MGSIHDMTLLRLKCFGLSRVEESHRTRRLFMSRSYFSFEHTRFLRIDACAAGFLVRIGASVPAENRKMYEISLVALLSEKLLMLRSCIWTSTSSTGVR